MSLVIQNWNKAMGIPQGCYICRKWDHENPTLKLWTNFFFCMLCPFGMFPLCLSHFSCHSSVGGIGRRFMSQGEHLSVTDQPVLLWWQVSPSPLWCLSSPTLIKSQCLAKCGVGTHLLPERPSNNWGLIGDPYSKLRGGFGSLYPASAQKGCTFKKRNVRPLCIGHRNSYATFLPCLLSAGCHCTILFCLRSYGLVQYSATKSCQPRHTLTQSDGDSIVSPIPQSETRKQGVAW